MKVSPELIHLGCGKIAEPRFGSAGKFPGPAAPDKAHGTGVQGLIRQNEPRPLLRCQAVFDQGQVQVFIAAVQFVANDGMAKVGKVKADLVFAAGARD